MSAVYETDPVGGPEQPDYLNAGPHGPQCRWSPIEVLALAHLAEQDLHRTREVRWGARTLDVDVINYGDVVSDDPVLYASPSARRRARIRLGPLLDADPQATLAGLPPRLLTYWRPCRLKMPPGAQA